jgi:hypothetical protein
MQKLHVGLVGAGLVDQAEHTWYVWEDRDRFEFAALAGALSSGRAAAGAGLHVLCEKPLASPVAGCNAIAPEQARGGIELLTLAIRRAIT